MLCGRISFAVHFQGFVVVVCWNNVQTVAFYFGSQVKISFAFFYGTATVNCVFEYVAENTAEVNIKNSRFVGQINPPVNVNIVLNRLLTIVIEQSIECVTFADSHRCCYSKRIFILGNVVFQRRKISFICKSAHNMNWMFKIMPCFWGVFYVRLQRFCVTFLNFKNVVSFCKLCFFNSSLAENVE